MADRYLSFTGTAPGRFLTRRLGLPQPAALRRDAFDGGLLHLTAGRSDLGLAPVLARTGLARDEDGRPAAVVLDATGVRDVDALAEVHAAAAPRGEALGGGRPSVVLGGADPADQPGRRPQALGASRSRGKGRAGTGPSDRDGHRRAPPPPRLRPLPGVRACGQRPPGDRVRAGG
ncbi:hypothetical protein STENM327S_08253 [Streptomyces tendae]